MGAIYARMDSGAPLSRLTRYLDEMPQLAWSATRTGDVVYANRRCVEYTGLDVTQKAAGGWSRSLHPDDAAEVFRLWEQAIAQGTEFTCEYRLRDARGNYHWFLGRAVPLKDDKGEILEWFGSATDIQDMKTAQEELHSARAQLERERHQLQMALETAGMGMCDCDLRTGLIVWDAQHAKIFGYEAVEQVRTMDEFALRIHPENRTAVMAEIEAATRAGQRRWAFEWRLQLPGGEIRWVRAIGHFEYLANGTPSRILGLALDITEEKATKDRLLAARAEADSANQAKTQFLANMSHEIRTPLGVMLGYVDLGLESPSLDPETRAHLGVVKSNGEALKRLIGELLDIAKIEASAMEIEESDTDLARVIAESVSAFEIKVREKNLLLRTDLSGLSVRRMKTDPAAVRQVLTNLLGNAVKFTPAGEIRLEAKSTRTETGAVQVEIRICDSGIGIADAHRSKLFQSFSQADSSMARKYGGTGLGLVISRRLAQLLGGDVCLLESGEQKGCKFEFRFISTAVSEPAVATNPARPSAPSLAGLRVLVVEDAEDNQDLISLYLTRAGAKVALASNGEIGVAQALASAPDVVLMDIQMPEVDGYEATRRLRRAGFGAPILALTAHALRSERDRALREGFDGYLTKPVDRVCLITAIAELASKGHTTAGAQEAGLHEPAVLA